MHYALWTVLCLSAGDVPLEIGSPSPKLASLTFLKREPVRDMSRGEVYVIEFSGTGCVPCIQCIPLLTELQKSHGEVVVISVYSEDEQTVRKYLDKEQHSIGYRVAADPKGVMCENCWRTICRASGRKRGRLSEAARDATAEPPSPKKTPHTPPPRPLCY